MIETNGKREKTCQEQCMIGTNGVGEDLPGAMNDPIYPTRPLGRDMTQGQS